MKVKPEHFAKILETKAILAKEQISQKEIARFLGLGPNPRAAQAYVSAAVMPAYVLDELKKLCNGGNTHLRWGDITAILYPAYRRDQMQGTKHNLRAALRVCTIDRANARANVTSLPLTLSIAKAKWLAAETKSVFVARILLAATKQPYLGAVELLSDIENQLIELETKTRRKKDGSQGSNNGKRIPDADAKENATLGNRARAGHPWSRSGDRSRTNSMQGVRPE